jgi:hypothetical protein
VTLLLSFFYIKGIKDLEIISHSYSHLIFDKGAKVYIGENIASSTMALEKLVINT